MQPKHVRWLILWNVVATSALMLIGAVHLVGLARAAQIGSLNDWFLGYSLKLDEPQGDPELDVRWGSQRNLRVYGGGPVYVGDNTRYSGSEVIYSGVSTAFQVYRSGQASPIFSVGADGSNARAYVRGDYNPVFSTMDNSGGYAVLKVNTFGQNQVEVDADSDQAFKVVKHTGGAAVFEVDTNGSNEIRASAPLLVDQVKTKTVGGDLVFTLQ
ncbi:MAG: hypothetical protein RBU30_24775 [Polyangia bacterium]|jgi:hypothetical protein|nr:hypothetical protein [Polyangia bacterium]